MAAGSRLVTLFLITLTMAVAEPPDDRRKVAEFGSKESPFSPRMYYDEWTPLGHGDPLKNDPTYDYVPPVLDHVHYWKEPSNRSPSTDQPPPLLGPSINARRDPPKLFPIETKPSFSSPNLYPQVPHTMLVPPPLPMGIDVPVSASSNLHASRLPPTTVDVEPVNMLLHSSTTISWLDFNKSSPTLSSETTPPWRAPNTPPPTLTTSTFKYRDEQIKERPFSPNSIFQQKLSPPVKPPKIIPSSIPIQPGQPFRLPSSIPPFIAKPPKKSGNEEKESIASLLQSLLESDVQTTTEPTLRQHPTSITPSNLFFATTQRPTMTTDHIFSHYKQPPVPVTAPLYLIIQGHSKVKTYGASKAPSLHSVPHNEVMKDVKSKTRFSRRIEDMSV